MCSPLVDGPPADLTDRVVPLADLPGQVDRPDARFALAFDGSLQEVAAREKYPSVRVEYVQLAGVAVVLPEFFDAREGSFVDPRQQAAVKQQIVMSATRGAAQSTLGGTSSMSSSAPAVLVTSVDWFRCSTASAVCMKPPAPWRSVVALKRCATNDRNDRQITQE
ncbi:MAG: hypothetical protein M1399_08775 [Actinobacteria bacterium]|nr:hypothetical protein [Actinomycetota bacterium]